MRAIGLAGAVVLGCVCGSAMAGSPNSASVGFDNGLEGWTAPGAINGGVGNPAPALDINLTDTFGITVSNDSSPAFIGDYTAKGPVTLSIDFKVNSITFFGQEVPRDLAVELRNYDLAQGGYPWTSVWAVGGTLTSNQPGWATFTFDVVDVDSAALPAGWHGYGAEDPNTFEPILPAGVGYNDVLAGVDEIAFTTFVPGFFFGFTNFDVEVDNISIQPIPSAGGAALLVACAPVALRRRRG